MVMNFFKGKVALITGAARGIGFATAELLAGLGASVVITDILEERLKESVSLLKSKGLDVMSVTCNVTDYESCAEAVRKTLESYGRLNILINNAGISIVAKFEECLPDTCARLMDVNFMGSVNMSLAGLEALKASKGHLIFVSSVSGIRAIPTGSIYGASKAALRSLAESLRLEFKPYGIHVGVITPGFTTSDPTKTVMKGDGTPRPIDRAPHDTPAGVAAGIAALIEKRQRERILTPVGKITNILQRVSPFILDFVLARKELRN
jgi:NAD(P)-dependent dehydrogenase (short-subunit alcohol dehydrogenase family)